MGQGTHRSWPADADLVPLALLEAAQQEPRLLAARVLSSGKSDGEVCAKRVLDRREAGQTEVLEVGSNIGERDGGGRGEDGLFDVGNGGADDYRQDE